MSIECQITGSREVRGSAGASPSHRDYAVNEPREFSRSLAGLRAVSNVLTRGWLKLYHRLTIVGREHLPRDRSFVMIANHASHLDTLCLLAALPLSRLPHVYPVAARDYWHHPARSLLRGMLVNALPFERHLSPWQSLEECVQLLEQPGRILILFPEGTRSVSEAIDEFKPGVALLAAGRNVPIVPCHLEGTYRAMPKGTWLPRPHPVRLTIGEPHEYRHLPANRDTANTICQELRDAVVRLRRTLPGV
jgi:1-acyl-sn-glycerol-3-phosphate acyltransferase